MKNSHEETVSTIQYTIVERFIENFVQQKRQIFCQLTLSQTTIHSNTHRFQLKNVFDMSFKPFTDGKGILYLHTNEGVFSYFIADNPRSFIETYKAFSVNLKK